MGLISELIGKHRGSPIVVVGGGPSAPDQVARAPEDSIFISANEHGTYLGLHDYFVIVDDLRQKPEKLDKIKATGSPIIGRDWWVDYRLTPYRPVGNSGMMAAYVAMLLGGHPILLAGMDCYQGNTYFHTEHEESTGHQKSQIHFGRAWEKLADTLSEQGAVVRSFGGPTTAFFPTYDPYEVFGLQGVPSAYGLYRGIGRIQVETESECPILGPLRKERGAPSGIRFFMSQAEFDRYAKSGIVTRVGV